MKLGRYSDAMKRFHAVIARTREELILALSVLLIVLVFASSMMYYAEHDVQPEKFSSIPAAMWWAIVTLATVGYGDVYPITTLGKVIGGVVLITGIAIFALPTAILCSGFIAESQKECECDTNQHEEVTCPACGQYLRTCQEGGTDATPEQTNVHVPTEKK
jgi:voltage-gated potassium channel